MTLFEICIASMGFLIKMYLSMLIATIVTTELKPQMAAPNP